jgi:hypothetical protein
LIYNLDPDGYPCSGAPPSLYVSGDYSEVCSLCYEMYQTIEKADWAYWHSFAVTEKLKPDPIQEHC